MVCNDQFPECSLSLSFNHQRVFISKVVGFSLQTQN